MGIRVHKVLGYGFRRVNFNGDPRFNDHALSNWNLARHELLMGDKVKERLSNYFMSKGLEQEAPWEFQMEVEQLKELKTLDATDVMRYNPMLIGAKPAIGPLVFTIPYMKWSRYNDTIDYYESTQDTLDARDRVRIITDCEGAPAGIYPFDAGYVHRRTGERKLTGTTARWMLLKTLRGLSTQALKPDNEFGVQTLIEFQRHLVPEVPTFIRAFCDCFQIFKQPHTVNYLRPMLFTYWS